ncbi:AAA family ATPase [Fictibacillus sp. WQ 8-8]|uniref:AAA family ATPase n=1 Tax=Fictibacillus sp. WQ 8-8 TaxID=2938788 RepID=UPI00210E8CFC|nr:AAA family ATPase [Fictibacillus sp. WQ 8-8]MCQ6267048.1 AAA family ATPase [Fictibacillus sp. WQ 8-8]
MWIKQLHIYHFGKFQNLKIKDLSKGAGFISGENEAGKSTLMSFIKCMLFGFPSKLTSERRYEPKDGNRMGGSLTLMTESHGELAIERVAGKAAGDVTVYLENGEQAGEDFLQSVLKGLDRSLFQGIYCFDIDGLQEIEKISRDQLGSYLLGAGMTGSKELQELEALLEKKQAALFKPGGRKPVINEMLQELHRAEEDLLKWKRKNEEFQPAALELKEVKDSIQRAEKEKAHHQEQWYQAQKWKSVLPPLQKWKENKLALDQLQEGEFPENGLQRLEYLQEKLFDLEGDLAVCKNKNDEIEKQLAILAIDEQVLKEGARIEAVGQKIHYLESLLSDKAGLLQKAELLSKEIHRLIHETGYEGEDNNLYELNNGIAAKNGLVLMTKNHELLQQKKEWMDQELTASRSRLESAEERLKLAKGKLLHEADFQKLKEHADQDRTYRRLMLEKEQLQMQIKNAEGNSSSRSVPLKKNWIPAGALFVFIAVIIIYLVSKGEMAGALLSALALGAGFLYWMKSRTKERGSHTGKENLPALLVQLQKLEEQLAGISNFEELDRLQQQWIEEQAQRNEYNRLQEEKKRLEQSYQQTAAGYDKLELEEFDNEASIQEWSRENGFNGPWQHLILPGYFEKIERLKELLIEKYQLEERLSQLQVNISVILEDVNQLSKQLGLSEHASYHERIMQARMLLQQEKEKQRKLELLQEAKRAAVENEQELLTKRLSYTAERTRLFQQAGADNEESYRKKGEAADSRKKIQEQLSQASLQLYAFGYSDEEIFNLSDRLLDKSFNLEKEIAAAEAYLKESEQELESFKGKSAELSLRLQQLQEEGSYSECLQRYETLKDILQDQARKWAVYRTAADLLKRTKEQFHAERLPAIIKKAGVYFSRITAGKYADLFLAGEKESLIIERNDGVRFNPVELSRGTAEQLYLCVRLSLASLYQREGMPLILDDVTVNFDPVRTKQTLDLLMEIGEKHQIIFFTCHETLFSDRPSVPVIHLKEPQPVRPGDGAFL